MAKPDLCWADCIRGELETAMHLVSMADGTITLMYGGYGHYYKVSWKIGGRTDAITAETPERFRQLVAIALEQGRFEA